MQTELLAKWWQPADSVRQAVLMRSLSTVAWILIAAELIQRIESGRLAFIVTGAGVFLWMTAVVLSPQCWRIVDALPGSNSRKALTGMVLFGFMLQISGLIARIPT